MMKLKECMKQDTPVYMVRYQKPRVYSFRRKEREPKVFLKGFNPSEIIGEELCRIKNIRCSHYFIAGIADYTLKTPVWYEDIQDKCMALKIASPTFKRRGYRYFEIEDFGIVPTDDSIDHLLQLSHGEENRKQLYMDLLNMIALDIYMRQTDRYSYNYMFEQDREKNIRLAPLFDFETSLEDDVDDNEIFSKCDLYGFETIDDCKRFIDKYPEFYDVLSSYLDLDLGYVVQDTFAKRRMNLPEKYSDHYRDFGERRKEFIKRIVQ